MDNLIRTENYKGFDINIYYDQNSESPDTWGNTDIFLVYDHRDFYVKVPGFDPSDIFDEWKDSKQGEFLYNEYFVFPVLAYIHSGVSLSLSDNGQTSGFDTSFKGFALVKKCEYWPDIETAEKAAKELLNEWNQYLSGEVYGYDSEAGSCWGFYGQDGIEQMLSEAKFEIDILIKERVKQHINKAKAMIKNKAPLYARESLTIV